ncbi:MAG TPA: CPBP family intramembrane glutamic endopeptidase [Methylomirabilota bacterium]|nr:CPBP family intramembrane glutamic endopeptidase [Methylomirabilota bacterium]
MLVASTEDVHASEPPPPTRYFSPWITGLFSALCLAVLAVYMAPWHGSPLDSLERPAEALERLVSRDLDTREFLRSAPHWEQRLYGMLMGDDDPLPEAIGWYEELVDAVESPAAELYYAVLRAESGEAPPRGAEGNDWVTAAYSDDRLDPELGREMIARIRESLPANWFTDTLVAHIATRIGDGPTAEAAHADIARRGRSILTRWRALSALEVVIVAAALGLLLGQLARDRFPRFGPARLPPVWNLGDGYALVVRAVLGLLGITLAVVVLLPEWRTTIRLASLLGGLPVILWTVAYLRARGESFSRTFGLVLPQGTAGRLLVLTLVLVGVGGAAEAAIGSLVSAAGVDSHWADGLPEDLLWDPPWLVVVGTLDTVVWTPFIEELTFRGLLYGTLRAVTGAPLAAVASGCLFAAAHGYGLAGFLSVFVSGILWALAYERSRSLLPGIVAHAVNNLSVTVTYLVMLRL